MKRKPTHFDKEIFIVGNTYWYKGTPKGLSRQVERSLKLSVGSTQRSVKKAKRDLLDELSQLGTDSKTTKYEVVVDKYIRFQERKGFAEKTIYEIKSYLGVIYNHKGQRYIGKHLGPYLKNKRVEQIDQIVFEDFCEKNKGKNFKPHAKTLNAFLKWCVQRRILKTKIQIEIPKEHKKKKRAREILTNDEIIGLLNALAGRALLYHSMYLLLGMRNSEIIKLKWGDVDLINGSLWVNPENNRVRKDRDIPINPFVLKMLNDIDKESEWVFPSREGSKKPHRDPSSAYRKSWKKALKEAGIDRHLTPHDMRATFEKFMHTNTAFTDTQREKMAGAKIDVQKNIYVSMRADDLRGLENSVQIEGLEKVFEKEN